MRYGVSCRGCEVVWGAVGVVLGLVCGRCDFMYEIGEHSSSWPRPGTIKA